MSLFQAIILAIIQGLTEFLPVSSTAHLVLFPWLLHWPDPGQAFDVALHAGTLLAVLLFFIRDWMELTLAGLGFNYHGRGETSVQQNRKLFWYLIAATIPAAIAGFLAIWALMKYVSTHRYTPFVIYRWLLGLFVLWHF